MTEVPSHVVDPGAHKASGGVQMPLRQANPWPQLLSVVQELPASGCDAGAEHPETANTSPAAAKHSVRERLVISGRSTSARGEMSDKG